jgi:hypothetical protein
MLGVPMAKKVGGALQQTRIEWEECAGTEDPNRMTGEREDMRRPKRNTAEHVSWRT